MLNSQRKKGLVWLGLGIIVPFVAFACQIFTPGVTPQGSESQVTEVAVEVVTQESIPQPSTTQIVVQVPVLVEDSALVDLYEKVNPSVVNITILSEEAGLLLPSSQGSGFVYDADGHIVTNAHVVHGSEQVDVTFADGTVRSGEVIGEDLNSDLAVVRIEEFPVGIKPLPLGNMEALAVGQTVVAIGNPFGLQGTLTRGIISALGRTIPALTPFSIPEAIQTDAAINPGNSGGPLLNLNGEVIGVNAQIETDGTSRSNLGVGFAIPVSIVQRVVPDLIEEGEHAWAWLGVRGGSLFPALVEGMNLPFERGAYIAEVVQAGPADNAGLRGADKTETVNGREVDIGGDVITAIDGQPVTSFDDLLIYIALNTEPGQDVTLTVYRDGKYLDLTVEMEARPDTISMAQE